MTNLAFGVRYATTGSVSTVEDWLSKNCRGEWDIRLADIDKIAGRKTLDVFFQYEIDKNAFKDAFTRKRA